MLRQTLNWVPAAAGSAGNVGSGIQGGGVQTLLHERKSSLQTRTLWLPGPQGDGEGLSD